MLAAHAVFPAHEQDSVGAIIPARSERNQPYTECVLGRPHRPHDLFAVDNLVRLIHVADFRTVERTRLINDGQHLEAPLAESSVWDERSTGGIEVDELHALGYDDARIGFIFEPVPASGGLITKRRIRVG